MKIQIYDTTLRDGTQREGISLSCDDKISIALKLDELGVDFIEGGWPGSNPKDVEFFQRARELPLKHAVITAFEATYGERCGNANLISIIGDLSLKWASRRCPTRISAF